MAWNPIRTDFKDAVWSGLRKFTEIKNGDGSVSFEDITQYTHKEDSLFGAKEVNQIAEAINIIMHMTENGTDLYTAFQTYFNTQKELFTTHTNNAMDSYENLYQNRISSFETTQTNNFNQWFDGIQTQLDGDVAGKLQNQANAHEILIQENKSSLSGLAPSNLLVNGDFQVNQRGENSYSISQNSLAYFVDMWWASDETTLRVVGGGVTTTRNCDIKQFVGVLETGKQYSYAICINGVRETGTFVAGHFFEQGRFRYDPIRETTTGSLITGILSAGDIINYVDLFKGEVAYPHVKEEYSLALQRCYRYLYVINLGNIGTSFVYYTDSDGVTAHGDLNMYLPIAMKTQPTLIASDIQSFAANGVTYKQTSLTVQSSKNNILDLAFSFNAGKNINGQGVLFTTYAPFILTCEPL